MLHLEMAIPRKTHFAPFSPKVLRSVKPNHAFIVDDNGVTWVINRNDSDEDTIALVLSQPDSLKRDFVFFDEELGFVNHDYQPLEEFNNPGTQLQIFD